MEYEPKGRTAILVAEMRRHDPVRVWSPWECAQVMECTVNKVCGTVAFAVGHALIYRIPVGRNVHYCLTKIPGALEPKHVNGQRVRDRSSKEAVGWATPMDDIRVPRYDPSYRFPKMVAPRSAA